jgi:uncharacterized DUF497 family protein
MGHTAVVPQPIERIARMTVPSIAERLYCCVYTRRGDTIRVISLRRASRKETRLWRS